MHIYVVKVKIIKSKYCMESFFIHAVLNWELDAVDAFLDVLYRVEIDRNESVTML